MYLDPVVAMTDNPDFMAFFALEMVTLVTLLCFVYFVVLKKRRRC